MYRVELYAQVRRSVFVEGLSEREAAKRFGLARGTVRKMLRYATPPGYRRRQPARRPKLDPFTGIVDQILIDDQERPKKQRHTAKRIFDRLRDEYDFTGGYTIVKDYVRDKKLGGQEMFVPLVHPPGDAQADFGEALVVIDGVQRKAHYLVVDLPHSDDAFVKAFPAETTEAFCEGHNAAFQYFGGVPRSILYDNTTLAVARQCAAESLDSRSFLQQLCELELLDREQRATERRIKAAKFLVTKSLDTFNFPALPALNKKLVLELARCEFIETAARTCWRWVIPTRARRTSAWRWDWRLASAAIEHWRLASASNTFHNSGGTGQ